ncbi:hypothetical protein K458DRAFT_144681 [Lentithecium fluviatile CBS 122367]|uniref:Zn(2)-C6 fungal-type domain-containing protein n=1 Tax=Lentithecium fluviatile CBS 122367 TaxID=1168545 RepID=A0A6G1IJ69_9PLEO|nr:hypothetical protein K458DRAFT_144681 [Lentithecium fluviatile CBS 122367]
MDSLSNRDCIASPGVKRRKIRKGTRSCWECKRRKVRCSFNSPSDETCAPCRRRRTTCVSQELPEELARGNDQREQSDRIERMEALLEQLGVAINSRDGGTNDGLLSTIRDTVEHSQRHQGTRESTTTRSLPTPSCSDSTPTSALHLPNSLPAVPTHDAQSAPTLAMRAELSESIRWNDMYADKLAKVSQALHAAFPAPQDVHILCSAYKDAVIFAHQTITKSHRELEANGLETVAQLAQIPDSRTHPVLMAKWMLLFALFLQQSVPIDVDGLSECPKIVTARLKDTATCLVTTNEELFGTVESLECILLEALFEKSRGHFRRAWLAVRRAMTAAQLMNLHRSHDLMANRIEPNSTTRPRYLWFRIIYLDRMICLMLGLPAVSLDIDMSVDMIQDTPVGQLERTHMMVAKRILERNEADSSVDDYAMTEAIDAELLGAAEKLPHQFWQPLDFGNFQVPNAHIFWQTLRLANQATHFSLLNHLHLPYLLPLKDDRYSSSKITCAHASRELLTRWMSFRDSNPISTCCRIGDFYALRAGLALCLAHLGNHHNEKPLASLRHQRVGDRSLIERTIVVMDVVSTQAGDPLARGSADLLRRILLVEADAAQGQIYSARKCMQEESLHDDESNVLSIYIPYFGVLKISPEGTISKEPKRSRPLSTQPLDAMQRVAGPGLIYSANELPMVDSAQLRGYQTKSARPSPDDTVAASPQHPLQGFSTNDLTGFDLPQEQSIPWPIAGVDDWAFQGVDTAFFDSLMRGMTGTTVFPSDSETRGDFGGHNQA